MVERWVALVVLVACAGSTQPADPGPEGGYRVLFIGNSLTAFNDLPGTVARLAGSVNDTIVVEAVTRPNLAVIDHVNGSSNAVDIIRGGHWDYVVLQQGPTSTQINRDTLILASRLLRPDIEAAGGRVAELMAWPARPNLAVFDGVLRSCVDAARAVAGVCLPAGEAWRAAWGVDPELGFYGPDQFHPSALGTYMAALVVYEGLTGHDARSLPDDATVAGERLELRSDSIALLQRIAHETVQRLTFGTPDQRLGQ